jgi:hypothetical protein
VRVGIFIGYVITVLVVRGPLRWSWPVLLAALAASIPRCSLVLRDLGGPDGPD